MSGGHEASETEARTLAPKVLGGEAGAAAPRAAPAASVNREGPPGTDQVSSEAPQICDPDNFTSEGEGQTSSSEADPKANKPAEPVSDGLDFTEDPTAIDVSSMDNLDLIIQTNETNRIIARFKSVEPGDGGLASAQTRNRGRTTATDRAWIYFLADTENDLPGAYFSLRPGKRSRDWLIVTTDSMVAYGPPDVTLDGPIMTWRQINAYIDTLGYERVTGTAANALLAIPETIMPMLESESLPGFPGLGSPPFLTTGTGAGTDEDDWSRPGTLPQYGGLGRYGMLDTTLGGSPSSLLDL